MSYEIEGFGPYFRSLVDASDFRSQAEIAQALRVSQRSVEKWLSGQMKPTATMCEQIGLAFGVSIAEVRAAAGKPLPTSIDSVFDIKIRSLMLGIDWTPERLIALREFLTGLED